MRNGLAATAVMVSMAASAEFRIDRSAMSDAYWQVWNSDVQAKIDADIEKSRKADGAFKVDAPDGAVLVLVVNWSARDTEADLGVRLPFADGTLEVATEEGLHDAPFAPSLRLALPREAVRLLRWQGR